MIKKNQKPIEVEASFKYVCPNPKCGFDHWISLKEAKTKGFKIVCDCNFVFSPKRIKKIKIAYYDDDKKKDKTNPPTPQVVEKIHHISDSLLSKASTVMRGFGFTKSESENLIIESYKKEPIEDYKLLVKNILSKIGENNVEHNKTSIV